MENSPCTAPDSAGVGGGGGDASRFPLHADLTSTSGAWNSSTTPVQIAGTDLQHLALGGASFCTCSAQGRGEGGGGAGRGRMMEGRGRGLQMGGAAAPWEGRVWAAAPGAGCFCLVLAIRTKDSSLGGPRGGRGLRQAGGITSLLWGREAGIQPLSEAALCQTPHAETETISKPAAPRASLSSQYHLPFPQKPVPSSFQDRPQGPALWEASLSPWRLPMPGVNPGLETCLLWALLWVLGLPGVTIFPPLFHLSQKPVCCHFQVWGGLAEMAPHVEQRPFACARWVHCLLSSLLPCLSQLQLQNKETGA